LDTVELIMEFEKEFGVTIPEDQAEKDEILLKIIFFLQKLINISLK
ncbi:MAG: acyl carrier protein, partial [Bacillota bacterium]|nr:acyl carrier protein [Bacillota bacterium]